MANSNSTQDQSAEQPGCAAGGRAERRDASLSGRLSGAMSGRLSATCPAPDNNGADGVFLYVVSPPQLGGAGACSATASQPPANCVREAPVAALPSCHGGRSPHDATQLAGGAPPAPLQTSHTSLNNGIQETNAAGLHSAGAEFKLPPHVCWVSLFVVDDSPPTQRIRALRIINHLR